MTDIVKKIHEETNFVHQKFPLIPTKCIRKVMRNCKECRSIDPPAVMVRSSSLAVKGAWQQITIDVTHRDMIDCEPNENANTLVRVFDELFRERGAPMEILLDNSTSFRSQVIADNYTEWEVYLEFRTAYNPDGI